MSNYRKQQPIVLMNCNITNRLFQNVKIKTVLVFSYAETMLNFSEEHWIFGKEIKKQEWII